MEVHGLQPCLGINRDGTDCIIIWPRWERGKLASTSPHQVLASNYPTLLFQVYSREQSVENGYAEWSDRFLGQGAKICYCALCGNWCVVVGREGG